MGATKEALVKIIPELNGSRKSRGLMKLFPRKIQFDLAGEEKSFKLEIENEQIKLTEDNGEGADIVVIGNGNEFAKVINAGLDVTHPIARGQIVITKGKVSEMTLLNRILWANKGA